MILANHTSIKEEANLWYTESLIAVKALVKEIFWLPPRASQIAQGNANSVISFQWSA